MMPSRNERRPSRDADVFDFAPNARLRFADIPSCARSARLMNDPCPMYLHTAMSTRASNSTRIPVAR